VSQANSSLVVVGGGASGMMAAITAAQQKVDVCLLERNPKVGRKLYITGKGRCNVTNHCSVEEVLEAVPRNSRFLYSCMQATPPSYMERFFETLGVALKVERGNRVFPKSDRSADIIDALYRELHRLHIPIIQARASALCLEDGAVYGIESDQGTIKCKAIILATGGLPYPATGSTGDGHRMAAAAGHTVVEAQPSLVPLESPDSFCAQMQGLALKNVELKIKNQKGKVLYQEQGELLFTHFGLSGPLILSASAHMRKFGAEQYTAIIDLKPALEEGVLDARCLRELTANPNRDMSNLLGSLAPRLIIPVLLERAGIPGDRKAHDLTKAERRRLVELFKHFTVSIQGPRPIEEAIVTSGGVKVGEVDPKTMASKKVAGLFFAGELLDVDAYTGGFNLQIAWATGRAAGNGAAVFLGSEM
jgi:predicted Rossmann fold flavoprotein